MLNIIKVVRQIVLWGVVLGPFSLWAEAERPIIAIAPFKTSLNFPGWESVLVVRDQVVAKLWSDYDCVVLNRSYGYSVSLEDSLKRMATISSSMYQPEVIYGANHVFSGTFQPGLGKTFGCVILISDLQGNEPRQLRTAKVKVSSITGAAGPISDAIAKEIGLKRKNKTQPIASASIIDKPRVGVVMPFMVIASDGMNKEELASVKTETRLRAELSLQNAKNFKLVDHAAIETLLKEHAMATLLDVPHFGRISQMAGADYMLLGSIYITKGGCTAELMIVDSRSSEILSAAMQSLKKDKLGDGIEQLSRELIAKLAQPHALAPSTDEQRMREAGLYLYMFDVEGMDWSDS